MSNLSLYFLSGRDIRLALPMKEAVEVMKHAFAELSAIRAVVPARTHIGVSEQELDGARRLGEQIASLIKKVKAR